MRPDRAETWRPGALLPAAIAWATIARPAVAARSCSRLTTATRSSRLGTSFGGAVTRPPRRGRSASRRAGGTWAVPSETAQNGPSVRAARMPRKPLCRLGFGVPGAASCVPCCLAAEDRDDWIRTSDPLLPKQVRYQAAPRPVEASVVGGGPSWNPRRVGWWGASARWGSRLGGLGVGSRRACGCGGLSGACRRPWRSRRSWPSCCPWAPGSP